MWWLLKAELWVGRSFEVQLFVVRRIASLLEAQGRQDPRSVQALLDFARDVCAYDGPGETADSEAPGGGTCPYLLMLLRSRRHARCLSTAQREQLLSEVFRMCAGICCSGITVAQPVRLARASDFEGLGRFIAQSPTGVLRARVLWLCGVVAVRESRLLSEQELSVARPNGWTNLLLHEVKDAPTMLAALANLVLYLASLPEHHQQQFLHLGGYALLSRQITTVATSLRAHSPSKPHAKIQARADSSLGRSQSEVSVHVPEDGGGKMCGWRGGSLWCDMEGQVEGSVEVEAVDPERHDELTLNLLVDLVFLGTLFVAHPSPAPSAVVLYLEAGDVLDDSARICGDGLLVQLDYLAVCSPLLQQQALNNLALLLEKSRALRAYLLSTPAWQPRLLPPPSPGAPCFTAVAWRHVSGTTAQGAVGGGRSGGGVCCRKKWAGAQSAAVAAVRGHVGQRYGGGCGCR